MDLSGLQRGATGDKIMQCGVDLSSGLALNGKNVVPYSIDFDGKTCFVGNRTTTRDACAQELQGQFVFHVAPGPNNSTFHDRWLEIGMNENYMGKCGVATGNN